MGSAEDRFKREVKEGRSFRAKKLCDGPSLPLPAGVDLDNLLSSSLRLLLCHVRIGIRKPFLYFHIYVCIICIYVCA